MPQGVCTSSRSTVVIVVSSRPRECQRSFIQPCIRYGISVSVVVFIQNIVSCRPESTRISSIKSNGDCIAIVIHIQNRRAFGNDGFVCVEACTVEARVCLFCPVNTNVSGLGRSRSRVNVGTVLNNGINRRPNVPLQIDCLGEIVTSSCFVLLPDDDGIVCFCIRLPLRVNCRGFVDGVTELEHRPSGLWIRILSSWIRSLGIPVNKRVAFPHHREKAFIAGNIFRFDKPRRIVSCTLAILVEDEPVALGSVYGELDITFNGDFCFVRVIVNRLSADGFGLGSCRITNDVA